MRAVLLFLLIATVVSAVYNSQTSKATQPQEQKVGSYRLVLKQEGRQQPNQPVRSIIDSAEDSSPTKGPQTINPAGPSEGISTSIHSKWPAPFQSLLIENFEVRLGFVLSIVAFIFLIIL